MGNPQATENFRCIKKVLMSPDKFLKQVSENKACFSYNYKQYGSFETWELAWGKLSQLPHQENVFHELIINDSKVKPYLDIEWFQEKYPDYYPDRILMIVKEKIVNIFKDDWSVAIKNNDIFVASCHRKKTEGYKYSYRIVISTHDPCTIVFQNTNCASFLAKRIRKELEEEGYDKEIIDISPYKKTQNVRLVGHCKGGEYIPMQKMNVGDDDLEYIITNIPPLHVVLTVPEQKDYEYKKIKNIHKIPKEDVEKIVEKIKVLHPTAKLENIDTNGFLQFNYTDRTEPCFCFKDKQVIHDKIGFFAYIYNNIICVACHSGNCVDDITNKKIIIPAGSLLKEKEPCYEKVDFDNSDFRIDHYYIKSCIYDDNYGMSNLFKEMYLNPKRIKWTSEGKNGISYFWNGNLWKEDDHSFINRLISANLVKVLRSYLSVFNENPDIHDPSVDTSYKKAENMIQRLNKGYDTQNIIKFLRPLLVDSEFEIIKDIHPGLLSCKNGVVDLKTGTIRPCIPSDNMTKCLKINFKENANSKIFDDFVKQITSSEEGEDTKLYEYLKWAIGYSMQGLPVKKMFFILYGEKGYNGKSMILNTIKNTLEYYSVAMDKSVIVNAPSKTGGSHSSELCQLENVRMGILSETKEDEIINDAQIKMLTGVTDMISVREIYGKQKQILPTLVPFVSSNHKLKINLKDPAMYERLGLIPFRLSFLDNPNPNNPWERKGDNNLAEKFSSNKEGILKWLVEASVFYHQNPYLKPPEIALEAKKEYRKEMDDYANFISKYFDITENKEDKVKVEDVFQKYKHYHDEYIKPNTRKGMDRKKTEKIFNDYFGIPVKNKYIKLRFKEDLDEDSETDY